MVGHKRFPRIGKQSVSGGMYENCSHCGLKYERENGFFFGAMYVSYAVSVAIFVTLWVAIMFLAPDMDIGLQIGLVVGGIIVSAPFNFWISRLVWINLFVHFRGEEVKEPDFDPKPRIIT